MQFVKDGPDIPVGLLQAQEDGEVAFFCGSGVSIPDGLPNFGDLLAKVYGALGTTSTALEAEEISHGAYDRAFGLLEGEDRFGRTQVRRAVHGILTPAAPTAILHKALLALGRTREGATRLVTTNFDRLFELARPDVPFSSAPRLPVPKQGKWADLVYLHGRLEDDPDRSDNLVLSSGDFGVAYLLERWAARFVCELFANFEVVFVGYSGGDRVMRYLLDALSAERLRGARFQNAYALEGVSDADADAKVGRWRASGIHAITYPNVDDHRLLRDTLQAWAKTSAGGLNSRLNIVSTVGRVSPASLPPETVSQFCWAAREKSGAATRAFASLGKDARVEWFDVFAHDGLLVDRGGGNHGTALVDASDTSRESATLGAIGQGLADWIGARVDSPEMLRCLLQAGGRLHPRVAAAVRYNLRRSRLDKALEAAWWLLLEHSQDARRDRWGLLEEVKLLAEAEWSPSLRQLLLRLLTPHLRLSAPRTTPGSTDVGGTSASDVSDLVRGELELGIPKGECDYAIGEIRKRPDWPQILLDVAPDLVCLLTRALDLRAAAGMSTLEDDGSTTALTSVAVQAQKRHFQSWAWLIELVRDSLEEATRARPPFAATITDLWLARPWPVFRRLVLHGTVSAGLPLAGLLGERMVADPANWLWSRAIRPEVFPALISVWHSSEADQRAALSRVLLSGPPRPDWAADEESWPTYREEAIWRFLVRMRFKGEALTAALEAEVGRIEAAHPLWRYQGKPREDHDVWFEVGSGLRTDFSSQTLGELEDVELHQVLEGHASNREGLLNEWRLLVGRDPDRGIGQLRRLAGGQWKPRDAAEATLLALASAELTEEQKRAAIELVNNDLNNVTLTFPNVLPDVLSRIAPGATGDLRDAVLEIANQLTTALAAATSTEETDRDYLGRALNRPAGRLAIAVLETVGVLDRDGGLSEDVRRTLERLIELPGANGRFARTIIASRVALFLEAAPEWAVSWLVPYFDFSCLEDATATWQGFLWQPWLTERTWRALEPTVLEACRHASALGNDHDRRLFGQLIGLASVDGWLDPVRGREFLRSSDDEVRAGVGESWQSSLAGAADRAESLWQDEIEPWFRSGWPKEHGLRGVSTSLALAGAVLETGGAFPAAVQAVKDVLTQVGEHVGSILDEINEKGLAARFPKGVIELANVLVPDALQHWHVAALRRLLDQAVSTDSDLATHADYLRLRDTELRTP